MLAPSLGKIPGVDTHFHWFTPIIPRLSLLSLLLVRPQKLCDVDIEITLRQSSLLPEQLQFFIDFILDSLVFLLSFVVRIDLRLYFIIWLRNS